MSVTKVITILDELKKEVQYFYQVKNNKTIFFQEWVTNYYGLFLFRPLQTPEVLFTVDFDIDIEFLRNSISIFVKREHEILMRNKELKEKENECNNNSR